MFRSFISRFVVKIFLAGLLVVVPLGLTYMVLKFLFDIFDGVLAAPVRGASGVDIPGFGLLTLLIAIYSVGWSMELFLGRRLIHILSQGVLRIPIVGVIYNSAKQLIDSFASTGTTGFKRVVMIEYPRPACWTIGFLTGLTQDESGNRYALVYIPTAPTPNSGWVAILPAADVHDTDLTVPDALKLVLSGGITVPRQIKWPTKV